MTFEGISTPFLDYKPCGSTVADFGKKLLNDVQNEWKEITGTSLTDLTCERDMINRVWRLKRKNGQVYEMPYSIYYVNDYDYAWMVKDAAICLLAANDIAGAVCTPIRTKKEKKTMKKDNTLAETVYQNTVEAIQDETKDKKKALDAEEAEKLAKAYADLERESMIEHVDKWADELYARYEALHRKGFADELAIEILKIYISNH